MKRSISTSGFGLRALSILIALSFAWGMEGAPITDTRDTFYDSATVQTVHLEVSPENLERLNRALPQRIYVPGTFQWNGHKLQNVGVRYKGNSSSIPNATHKRGFLIAFSEFNPGQRFLGLRHAALDNGIQFGSLFSERLITEALLGVGVKASRCNYAKVYLNGKYAGVYVNVERIDKSFLEQHFSSADGILFKVDEGGPGADLKSLGDDPTPYRRAFELHCGKERKAFASLLELIHVVDGPSGNEVELSRVLEVDAFLKTTAVMLFAGAFDQYTGWGPHNYYLYRNPADQRWTYIPWDLDVGFADQAFGRVPVLDGWHAAWPAPVPGRPLMEQLVASTNLLERYREQASTILENWFRPEILIPKLHALYGQIETALAEDPYPPQRVTVPSDRDYNQILATMEVFMRKRYAQARAQLDTPGARPQPIPMEPKESEKAGPQPGPPSADSPTDLQVSAVTGSKVQLRWTDNAKGEFAHVVQRCTGAGCMDFVNLIGQPGEHIETALDEQVRPGETYR